MSNNDAELLRQTAMTDSTQATPRLIDQTTTPPAEFLLETGASSLQREGHTDEDVAKQLSALLEGAGALDLGSMSQISITGPDRIRWLNGMVTNSIQALEEGQGNYNFILNVQGRIQGDGYIYRQGERLLLETSQSLTQKLLDHLEHFIIMDDVELKPLTGLTALGVAGPAAPDVLRKLGLPPPRSLTLSQVEIAGVDATLVHAYESSAHGVSIPRYELWCERQHVGVVWQTLLHAGATACGNIAAEALRILEGIPAYGVDLHDRDLPQETGQMRALSFSKGCYLGQEIVERIRSRGNVHRLFTRLELTGRLPKLPADLRVDAKIVGQITSAAPIIISGSTHIPALGFIRTETISGAMTGSVAANQRIEYDGGIARPIENTPTPVVTTA